MIKGTQRKVIVLKDTKSGLFDEAYFIMKNNAGAQASLSEYDMLREADRIISFSTVAHATSKKEPVKKVNRLMWFLAGAFTSGSIFAAVLLFLRL